MSDNLYNFTYYIGAILFGLFLYSLESFSSICLVGLSAFMCSLMAFTTTSYKWEKMGLLGILISSTGMFMGLILKFLDYLSASIPIP